MTRLGCHSFDLYQAHGVTDLAELDKRLAKTHPRFRKEGRVWRELAAGELAGEAN